MKRELAQKIRQSYLQRTNKTKKFGEKSKKHLGAMQLYTHFYNRGIISRLSSDFVDGGILSKNKTIVREETKTPLFKKRSGFVTLPCGDCTLIAVMREA